MKSLAGPRRMDLDGALTPSLEMFKGVVEDIVFEFLARNDIGVNVSDKDYDVEGVTVLAVRAYWGERESSARCSTIRVLTGRMLLCCNFAIEWVSANIVNKHQCPQLGGIIQQVWIAKSGSHPEPHSMNQPAPLQLGQLELPLRFGYSLPNVAPRFPLVCSPILWTR
ncbi:hypothetical protein BJX68DRAFT_229398 [Aspergillus pseudodeflectus]|uniref:Uncharacterized protein n=1 Tax=Aspergillus pseudodeflectus TaxID=176178 RepID=A0ABR4KY77_9EURO